jgi:hypothetical protein
VNLLVVLNEPKSALDCGVIDNASFVAAERRGTAGLEVKVASDFLCGVLAHVANFLVLAGTVLECSIRGAFERVEGFQCLVGQ